MANYPALVQIYNHTTYEWDNVPMSVLLASVVDDGKFVIPSETEVRVLNLGESCVMLDPEPEPE